MCWPIVRLAEGQLSGVDYWIAVSKKVGTERLIQNGQKQRLVSQEWRF